MRVSSLIHEMAWHSIKMLHEFEPVTYNKFIQRVPGVNCFNHLGKDVMPRHLPAYFTDWREYRDYLLRNLVTPENQTIFINRWRDQADDEFWYRTHIQEILVNDIDGTINNNARSNWNLRQRKEYYRDQHHKEVAEYLKTHNKEN